MKPFELGALFSACLTFGVAAQGGMPEKEDLKAVYQRHKQANPRSCETLYYGLFAEGTDKDGKLKENFKGDSIYRKDRWAAVRAATTADRQIQRKEEIAYLLRDAKSVYLRELLPKMHAMSMASQKTEPRDPVKKKALIDEWDKRVRLADVVFEDGKEGSDEVGMDPFNEDKVPLDFLLTLNKPGFADAELLAPRQSCELDRSPKGKDLLGRDIHSYEEQLGTYGAEKRRPVIHWGANRLVGVESKAANAFTMGHELSHALDWAPAELAECLDRELDAPDREAARRLRKAGVTLFGEEPGLDGLIKKGSPFPDPRPVGRLPHEGVTYGSGTERTAGFLEKGILSPTRSLDEDGLPSFSEYDAGERKREAVADYMGIGLATWIIKKDYATVEDRRQAALAVLFFWAPELLSERDRVRANFLGSKRMPETRVFRTLLANKEFRGFLGCELETPVKECP